MKSYNLTKKGVNTIFKQRLILPSIFISLLFIQSCSVNQKNAIQKTTTKIAFGSCGSENQALPIFDDIVLHKPDLFVFLGDNIYGDTDNMDTLKAKYQRLASKKSFQNLKANVPIIATWDDHDYGQNDIGKHYAFKEESKEIFLDFFNEPVTSTRRNHKGIYHSYIYEIGKQKLQMIVLDGRTFRDDLLPYKGEFDKDKRYSFYEKDYAPHITSTPTLLGAEQWTWLENELKQEADLRIICSGTQFGIEWNGYEAWANFPLERDKMLDVIKKTKANGVMFISGDVHYSEISKLDTDFYPIYDFTSSGLSSTWHFPTPNKNRIEGPVMDNHFGLITIFWDKDKTKIKMENWDINNNQRFEFTLPITSLQSKK